MLRGMPIDFTTEQLRALSAAIHPTTYYLDPADPLEQARKLIEEELATRE